MAISLACVALVFSLLQPAFLTPQTAGDVLTVAAEIGVVAVGVTLLMIAGEFDLSVGSNFAFSAMVGASLVRAGWPPAAAFLVALLAGEEIGRASCRERV